MNRNFLFSTKAASAWLVLILGLIATVFGGEVSRQQVERVRQENFGRRIQEMVQAVDARLAIYEQALRGAAAFFKASDMVSREDWRRYVEYLQIRQNYPGIQGVALAVVVPAAELEQHVTMVRAEGFPHYSVRPEGVRDPVTPILFIEPFDWRNRRAFGFDPFSEPVRRAAMERARDAGEIAATGKVELLQETEDDRQAGFLMYEPLYRATGPFASTEDRRAAIQGWVYSPFRVDDLMRGIFGAQHPDIRMMIYDGSRQDPALLMHDSARAGTTPFPEDEAGIERLHRMSVGGRTWTLVFQSLPGFDVGFDSALPGLVFGSGVLISVLLFALTAAAARRSHLVESRAAMAQSLREKESLLREVHHRVKNNLQGLLGMVQIERSRVTDPVARERFEAIGRRITVMGNVHRRLYGSGDVSRIDLAEHLGSLSEALPALLPEESRVRLEARADPLQCDLDTAIPIGLLVNELVTNSLKHAFPDGREGMVRVDLRQSQGCGVLTVSDNGIGTRGQTGKNAGGIGLMIVRALAAQLDARLEIRDEEAGYTTTIVIPGRRFIAA